MKKRYVVALVVIEQVLDQDDGDRNMNGAWLNHEQREWALVDSFHTEKEAMDASLALSQRYHETTQR